MNYKLNMSYSDRITIRNEKRPLQNLVHVVHDFIFLGIFCLDHRYKLECIKSWIGWFIISYLLPFNTLLFNIMRRKMKASMDIHFFILLMGASKISSEIK